MNSELSYIEKLVVQIENIISITDEMLDNSEIYYHDPNANSGSRFYIMTFKYHHWRKKDERNQIKAKEEYQNFYSNFQLLLKNIPFEIQRNIDETNLEIINLIEQEDAPSSIEDGKVLIRNCCKIYKDFLNLLDEENGQIIILPDTNSLIQYPNPSDYSKIADSEKYEFVILPTVLSELDKLKMTHRNEDFRKKVTSVIKRLKGYRKQGDVLKGVVVNKKNVVRMIVTEPDFDKTLNWLDSKNNDDRIIANALDLQVSKPYDKVIFVSSDLNFQNKAQLANLTVYDTDELE